jgi:RNA polymerase sigma factor (sigma-70 family)
MVRVATEPLGDAMRRLGRTPELQSALSQTDAQLLERFVARRDEPAFAALMVRHGPMVLCLCRQMLRDAQEAEDAFQAAFLVLVRNAKTIRKRPSLSAWLYGVAYKVAARLRGRAERRRKHEQPGVDLSATAAACEPVTPDLRFVLHEEIRRLPGKYRTPVLLCYLEGQTNDAAARQLHWPVGTVKARLSRAREMLRLRLARRGLGAVAAMLPGDVSHAPARNTASVIVPVLLFQSTIRAAMRLMGQGVAGGWATARAVGLARAVAAAMQLAKLKSAAMLLLAVFVLGAGTTSLTCLSPTAGPTMAASSAQTDSAGPQLPAQAAAPAPPNEAAGATTKNDASPDNPAAKVRPNDVAKLDPVQRLRELVQQLFMGSRLDRGADLSPELRSTPRSDELHAHPYPLSPAQHNTGPDKDPCGSDCMDS